jgi:uncharacterized protein YcbX
MELTSINIYPLKSARRLELTHSQVSPLGLEYDRHWMLVDENNRFISARLHPQLLMLSVEVSGAGFIATYPGLPGIYVRYPKMNADKVKANIWKDEVTVLDAGEKAAQWFSQMLEKPCRLVWSSLDSARLIKPGKFPELVIPADRRQLAFTDAMPILLTNTASLAALNQQLSRPVNMHRFRPNLVVNGELPWEEEHWPLIQIGELRLQATKTCVRCVMTTYDMENGDRDPHNEPLKTLTEIHNEPQREAIFGMQFVALNSAVVKLGDRVKIK